MRLISIESLSFVYRNGSPVFTDLNLELGTSDLPRKHAGCIIAIMGASGCGKSTLLKLIAGIESPTSGRLVSTPSDVVVSYVPQEPVLFEHMSRIENARYYENISALRKLFRKDLFEQAVDRLGLGSVLSSTESVREMSGGERQRLSLLRAISIRPGVLLLDEPCSGLDAPLKYEFLLLLRQLTEELGLLTVHVTHHPDEVHLIADEIVFLHDAEDGCCSALHGTLEQFTRHPPTIEVAQFLATPIVNIVPCTFGQKELLIGGSSGIVFELNHVVPRGGYQLAFPIESVHWVDVGGLKVRVVGKSPTSTVVTLADNPVLRLVGPHSGGNPTAFTIEGDAFLFDAEGKFVQSTVLRGLPP